MLPLGRLAFVATAAAIAFAGLHVAACGSSDTVAPGSSSGGGIDLASVIYEGQAGDEALAALLDAQPIDDSSRGTVFDEPEDGAQLDAALPSSLRWHVGSATGRTDSLPVLHPGLLERLLSPIRSASAHGPPLNGRAYFLLLSSTDGVVAAVFTTDLKYSPDADTWAALAGAEGPIKATLLNAIFENNRITSDGGPFVGQAISFTID